VRQQASGSSKRGVRNDKERNRSARPVARGKGAAVPGRAFPGPASVFRPSARPLPGPPSGFRPPVRPVPGPAFRHRPAPAFRGPRPAPPRPAPPCPAPPPPAPPPLAPPPPAPPPAAPPAAGRPDPAPLPPWPAAGRPDPALAIPRCTRCTSLGHLRAECRNDPYCRKCATARRDPFHDPFDCTRA